MHTTDQLNTALAGNYAIERRIGAGGMAVVYLARDLKHNRHVALKVLNPELGAVLGLERFTAEIEVTAKLHHPNLLPLFDSGEAGGLLFYTMPFIEGETLREKLSRERQFGIDEAVRIAVAVCGALDYAHRQNVIHRDLKPENILMHEGQPLVMDFGIALAVSRAGGARITQTGLSLGTPQYMSPEQATGDYLLDARSDIYSLGAVLYEMLIGDPPHTGSTVQAVIAKVITEQPSSVRATRPTVPEHVEAAVMTALAKLPADRFATAADFAAALSGQRAVSLPRGTAVGADVARRSFRRPAAREVVGWSLAIAGISGFTWLATRSSPAPTLGRFVVELPESLTVSRFGPANRVALSRDGSKLVFRASTRNGFATVLALRHTANGATTLIPGTDSGQSPAFSPTGDWVVFSTGSALKRVSLSGGKPQVLATTDAGTILESSWGDDGNIVYRVRGSLWKVSASGGGAPRRFARPDTASGVGAIQEPEVLPGSRYAVVGLAGPSGRDANPDSVELGIVDLSNGSKTKLGILGSSPHLAPPGWLLFIRGSALFAVPFSPRSRKVTGAPERVLDISSSRELGVAQNGWLVYTSDVAVESRAMWRFDERGSGRQLKADVRPYMAARISPDGRRLVVATSQRRGAEGNLWIYDIASGSLTPLTNDGVSYRPSWSADGARVFYVNGPPAATRILSRVWDGSAAESTHLRRGGIGEVAIGPAGGFSALRMLSPRDIYLAPTESLAAMRPFIQTPVDETDPAISPNGRWLAYESLDSRRSEVYLRPIAGVGGRVRVSIDGGATPRWSSDSKTLYYLGPRRLMAATIASAPELSVVRRDSLFNIAGTDDDLLLNYDVFPNSREFVLVKGRIPESRMYMLVNWQQLLGKSTAAQAP
jgi:serine/threonine protein kinase